MLLYNIPHIVDLLTTEVGVICSTDGGSSVPRDSVYWTHKLTERIAREIAGSFFLPSFVN
jgi:hypothetical protein